MPEWWGHMISSLQALTPLAALIAAILAWGAKIWWAKEFAKAKDETIRAKDAQIAAVRAQGDAVRFTKDERVKAKDAEIIAIKSQISSLTNSHNQILKEKDAHIIVLEHQVKALNDLNPLTLQDNYIAAIELINKTTNTIRENLEQSQYELLQKMQ